MTMARHRLPADTAALELKTLPSVIGGDCVVGLSWTEKARDSAPQSFRLKTMVRFSPAGRGAVLIVLMHVFLVAGPL